MQLQTLYLLLHHKQTEMTHTKKVKANYQLRYKPTAFSTQRNAESFAAHCTKLHLIVLGDNCTFWVCIPADAAKLVKSGYEYCSK